MSKVEYFRSRWKRIQLVVVLLFLHVFVIPSVLGSDKKWEIVSDHEFPPYNYFQEGNWTGLDTEIVKAIFADMGVQAKFNPMPWKRAEIQLKAGLADLGYQMVFTEERNRTLELIGPFRYGETIFAVPKDSPIRNYNSIEDFRGLQVGAIRGFAYTPEFDRSTHFTLHSLTTNEQLVMLLASRRIDVAIFDSQSLSYWMKRTGTMDKIRVLAKVYGRVPRYLGVPKGRKKEAHQVETALRRLQKNGKIDKIIGDWKSGRHPLRRSSTTDSD